MTRADLIERISEKGHMIRSQAALVVDTVFNCMEQSIGRGERIELRGLGTFHVRSYRAFKGRNPRTGQIVDVKPKRLPHFKVSTELAARVARSIRQTLVPIGIGAPDDLRGPLPHHPACGSAPGGSEG